jgi:hypothetical protein
VKASSAREGSSLPNASAMAVTALVRQVGWSASIAMKTKACGLPWPPTNNCHESFKLQLGLVENFHQHGHAQHIRK